MLCCFWHHGGEPSEICAMCDTWTVLHFVFCLRVFNEHLLLRLSALYWCIPTWKTEINQKCVRAPRAAFTQRAWFHKDPVECSINRMIKQRDCTLYCLWFAGDVLRMSARWRNAQKGVFKWAHIAPCLHDNNLLNGAPSLQKHQTTNTALSVVLGILGVEEISQGTLCVVHSSASINSDCIAYDLKIIFFINGGICRLIECSTCGIFQTISWFRIINIEYKRNSPRPNVRLL